MYLHLTAAFLASLFHLITGLRFRFAASPTDTKHTAQALTTIDARLLSIDFLTRAMSRLTMTGKSSFLLTFLTVTEGPELLSRAKSEAVTSAPQILDLA